MKQLKVDIGIFEGKEFEGKEIVGDRRYKYEIKNPAAKRGEKFLGLGVTQNIKDIFNAVEAAIQKVTS